MLSFNSLSLPAVKNGTGKDDEASLGKNISLKLKPIDLLNLALRCVVLVRLIKNMVLAECKNDKLY